MSFSSFIRAFSARIRASTVPFAPSFLCAMALINAETATAQNGPATQASSAHVTSSKATTAPVVTQKPVVDGILNDPAWTSVAPMSGFVQRELHEGQPVTERTEVRIVSDGEAIYVAAAMFDRDPQSIVPGEKIRDVALENSDYVALIFD